MMPVNINKTGRNSLALRVYDNVRRMGKIPPYGLNPAVRKKNIRPHPRISKPVIYSTVLN